MDSEIKITAHIEFNRQNACRFAVDRPICDGSYSFPDRKTASGSPLAEALFAREDVAEVILSGGDVTVTRTGSDDWRAAAKEIADIIRAHIRSGAPAVSATLKASLPSAVELKNKVQAIFDQVINPAVGSHGGFVELVDVKDNKIFLRMGGGCHGCGMSNVTLKDGIEQTLRRHLPQIGEIVDVTDHASGANPFYR